MGSIRWDKITTWCAFLETEGIGVQVKMHGERDEDESSAFMPPRIWNTYLAFRDHRRIIPPAAPIERNPLVDWLWGKTKCYEGPLSGLSWNGGVTYYEESTNADGTRLIEIGDDYAHSWDDGKRDLYDLDFMQRAVETLAKEAYALAAKEGILTPKENNNAK